MMNLSFTVTGIIVGLLLTFWIGVIYFKHDHWIPQTIISGLIIIPNLYHIRKIGELISNI